MLASTVKFSKYDRSHIKIPRLPDALAGEPGGSWGYVVRETSSYELIPQDPTVCLIRWILHSEVPLSEEKY